MITNRGLVDRVVPHERNENVCIVWGTMEDESTFDLPVPKSSEHKAGDEVWYGHAAEQDEESDIADATHNYFVIGAHFCTILFVQKHDEGDVELLGIQVISKDAH